MNKTRDEESKAAFQQRLNAAKSIFIVDVFHRLGLNTRGEKKHTNDCPKCGESTEQSTKVSFSFEKNVWLCFACNAGGSGLDAVMLANQCKIGKAVDWLVGQDTTMPARKFKTDKSSQKREAQKQKAVTRTALQEVEHNKLDKRESKQVWAYLLSRGFSKEIIGEAFDRGLLFQLSPESIGKDKLVKSRQHNLVFPYRNKEGVIVSAEFKSTWSNPKGTKSFRYGKLMMPWVWKGKNKKLAVTESILDAIALVELGFDGSVIAIPGVGSWRSFWKTLPAVKGASKVYIALDADEAGDTASEKLATKMGGKTHRMRPENGAKDWNEMLLLQKKKAA